MGSINLLSKRRRRFLDIYLEESAISGLVDISDAASPDVSVVASTDGSETASTDLDVDDISDNQSKDFFSNGFVCIHCSKKLRTKAQLNTHLKSHSEDRPHKCKNKCDKAFKTASNKRRHERICVRLPKSPQRDDSFTSLPNTSTSSRCPQVLDIESVVASTFSTTSESSFSDKEEVHNLRNGKFSDDGFLLESLIASTSPNDLLSKDSISNELPDDFAAVESDVSRSHHSDEDEINLQPKKKIKEDFESVANQKVFNLLSRDANKFKEFSCDVDNLRITVRTPDLSSNCPRSQPNIELRRKSKYAHEDFDCGESCTKSKIRKFTSVNYMPKRGSYGYYRSDELKELCVDGKEEWDLTNENASDISDIHYCNRTGYHFQETKYNASILRKIYSQSATQACRSKSKDTLSLAIKTDNESSSEEEADADDPLAMIKSEDDRNKQSNDMNLPSSSPMTSQLSDGTVESSAIELTDRPMKGFCTVDDLDTDSDDEDVDSSHFSHQSSFQSNKSSINSSSASQEPTSQAPQNLDMPIFDWS